MKPNAAMILGTGNATKIYGARQMEAIHELTNLVSEPMNADQVSNDPGILQDVEIIFSGWGMPQVSAEFLQAAPNLKALFYGAGSVQGFVTDALFDRGIVLTSSWRANAVPVAEYTFAQVILALRQARRFQLSLEENRRWDKALLSDVAVPGTYDATIGLVSLGMIGRMVLDFLKLLDANVIAYDIDLTPERAQEIGVQSVSLTELFERSDVVSLHTALLPATYGMITGAHIASMKKDATFINTSRGRIVKEAEMIQVIADRPDLTAVLDVVYPEPPPSDSRLFDLPNVVMTPHIAGSLRTECRRMGEYAVNECRRWLSGKPLEHQVTREMLQTMA